jgi:hypothetical protein
MAWVAVATIGGGLLGAYSSSKSNDSADERQKQALEAAKRDPRADAMLYGNGTEGGLLSQYQQLGQAPQNAQLEQYGKDNLAYLGNANQDMGAIRGAATGLLGGQQAPQAQAAQMQGAQGSASTQNGMAYNVGNMVKAPSQNAMDLSGSYNSFIGGDRGGNTRLTSAIQGGIDQSTNQFKQMQGLATENLQENILPGIRSNSVLSGQYGGSRQGIAEGNAIGDHAKAMQQAATQFGQNNTNAAVGAQANAYETDSNRALSATQGLGAQQYGVAQQDANTKNAAEFANVSATNGIAAQNLANQQQMGLANLGMTQQANQTNAGYQQQANLANLGASQSQNQLNQAGAVAGGGMLGGLLGGAAQAGQAQDGYAIGKAQQVGGLLQPYLGQQGVQVQQAPQSSVGGSALGGAMAGMGLYNQFNQMTKAGGAPTGGSMVSAFQNSPFGYTN